MKLWLGLAAMCVLVLRWSPCPAQTAQEAQSLPLPQLARLVLGEVGLTIIDVDRPSWLNHCGGPLCPPLSLEELRRRGPAPLTEQGLTFYQRPVPTPGGLQWTGLCSSTAIHVFYEGKSRPGRVEVSKRFGFPESAKSVAAAGGPSRRDHFEEEAKACGAINSVQDFFYSDDETAAYRAALVSRLVARAVQSRKPLPFAFTCRVFSEPCSGTKEITEHFRLQDIHGVSAQNCSTKPETGKPAPSCYEISLGLGRTVDVSLVEQNEEVHLLAVSYHEDVVCI